MKRIQDSIKLALTILLVCGLLFSSGVFSVLIYYKLSDLNSQKQSQLSSSIAYANPIDKQKSVDAQKNKDLTLAHIFKAPTIRQNPELPNGCEVTSLTMLLQYDGIQVKKTDLAAEMKVDPTPIQWNPDGTIKYWGNPNIGFVGDISNKHIGFGIYHTALMELLKKYKSSAIDLTGHPFRDLEQQISHNIPVVVWTTINYKKPSNWVVWNSPLGPFRTSFSEHAVLLVGYDQKYVYINDPLSGKAGVKVNKNQFISSWYSMGRQALSYQSKK